MGLGVVRWNWATDRPEALSTVVISGLGFRV